MDRLRTPLYFSNIRCHHPFCCWNKVLQVMGALELSVPGWDPIVWIQLGAFLFSDRVHGVRERREQGACPALSAASPSLIVPSARERKRGRLPSGVPLSPSTPLIHFALATDVPWRRGLIGPTRTQGFWQEDQLCWSVSGCVNFPSTLTKGSLEGSWAGGLSLAASSSLGEAPPALWFHPPVSSRTICTAFPEECLLLG